MDTYSLYFLAIQVAATMKTLVYHEASFPGLICQVSERSPEKSGSDY